MLDGAYGLRNLEERQSEGTHSSRVHSFTAIFVLIDRDPEISLGHFHLLWERHRTEALMLITFYGKLLCGAS
jgi:hypothetical protein